MSESNNWLKNSSFDPSLFSQLHAEPHRQHVPELLALAESSSEGEEHEGSKTFHAKAVDPSRKQSHDGDHKEPKLKRKKKEGKHRHKKRLGATKVSDTSQRLHFVWGEDLVNGAGYGTYCLDARLQADNLVYQKTYVYDKPAFRRSIPQPVWVFRSFLDTAMLHGPAKKKQRRFTTRAARVLETDVNRPKYCIQMGPESQPQVKTASLRLPLPAYIPVADEDIAWPRNMEWESEYQAMRRRTIAYNRTSVENPTNLQNWLDFAAFQDEFQSFMAAQKEGNPGRSERSVAEKKVDILQRALRHHPESVDIIGLLIDSTKVFEDLDQTKARYEDAVRDPVYSRSPQLWAQYLEFHKHELLSSNRGLTTVSEILQLYDKALLALAKERLRLLTALKTAAAATLETALLEVLLSSCRMSMQAGYTELAVSRIQASIEFTILAPAWSTAVPGPGGDHVRLPLFEEYWRSGAPLLGEAACKGWQEWAITHQDPSVPPPPPPPDPQDSEPGGWSGWQELEIEAVPDVLEQNVQDAPAVVNSDDELDATLSDLEAEVEEDWMSKRLEEEAQSLQAGTSLPQEVLLAWTTLERRRDRCEWQPQRISGSGQMGGKQGPDQGTDPEEELVDQDSNALQAVQFEDIQACLFSMCEAPLHAESVLLIPIEKHRSWASTFSANPENLRYLVYGLLRVLDVPVDYHLTSNSPALTRELNARASMWPQLMGALIGSDSLHPGCPQDMSWLTPDFNSELGFNPLVAKQRLMLWFQADESRHAFVRRALSLLITTGALNLDAGLCEALVHVTAAEFLRHPVTPVEDARASELEALGVFEDRGTDPSPSRQEEPGPEIASTADLAASLGETLQQQSSGSPLWTAYATHELLHGNLKRARRSFDAYLINSSQSGSSKVALASIALAHAKAELARSGRNSAKIVMHVLSWLSCGPQLYVPFDDKSATQLPSVLAVRHGFQKEISRIVSHSRAPPTEDEGAYLLAAALFETLAVEPGQRSSCTQLLRNAVKEFEPEVRRNSPVLEKICIELCTILVKDMFLQRAAPREARTTILEALQDYSRSSCLLSLLIQVERRSFLLTQLRVRLRDICEEQGSVPLWLLAAGLEFAVSPHRLQQFLRGAAKHEEARHSPLWQRACFAFSLLHGKDNLDITFAQMTDSCPWVKEVWMEGLRFEGNHRYRLSEAERREIRLRTSLEEVIYTLAGQRIESKGL